ncbi:hypothetical protein ACFL28_05395, partial [Candidatus Omnitrophota bacterium]
VFFVSLLCICLELFFTRILNLKTWNHVVYVIIPFAILGYGIGANIYLIFRNRINKLKKCNIIATLLLFLAIVSILTTLSLIHLPLYISFLMNFFVNIRAALSLSAAYTILMVPFIIIGFLVVYLFSENPKISNKLYFCDLLGAGLGAIIFFFLISMLDVFHSLMLLSLATSILYLVYSYPRKKWIAGIPFFICLMMVFAPEPTNYNIDETKGLNLIPKFFKKHQYETIVSKWSPLGRTNGYLLKDKIMRDKLYNSLPGTFEINLSPRPEFSYFCTDFLAGTPIYKLSQEGLSEYGSMVKPFSQAMEFPYLLLNEPKVVVIGAGGGRDIFMARTHNAKEIIGAEINPVIHSEMSRGGKFHKYSGGIYDLKGIDIENIDGRHLVKKLESSYFDLIVLNGVDTFSGLSTGAYAYAESYLYTKNAVMDYLRILDKDGMINFNRWFFPTMPRETLRLFVISLDALRDIGIEKPWQHIVIGYHEAWGMMLIKKSPFTAEDIATLKKYFQGHTTALVFPTRDWKKLIDESPNPFESYVKAFSEGRERQFINSYPFDVSIIYDNNPFFYKYYRFRDFHFKKIFTTGHPVSGTIVFMTQIFVLIYAFIFIILFIVIPLFVFKRDGLRSIAKTSPLSFIIFFSCLGIGFMFIEIPIMQRFALLLGSPIYSISVSLAALLIFSGLGSLLLTRFQKIAKSRDLLLTVVVSALVIYLIAFVSFGTQIVDYFLYLSFILRILIVCLILAPLGICLGMFFPSGLQVISQDCRETIAWAWGINCGFTVLGSMLAIILGQFYGFNAILLMAVILYLIAIVAFKKMILK